MPQAKGWALQAESRKAGPLLAATAAGSTPAGSHLKEASKMAHFDVADLAELGQRGPASAPPSR